MGAVSALRGLIAPATGAAVIGSTLAPEEAEAGVITKGGKRLIEAWHGSPHTFDKFDISKIGTGEGAQAYGHGLYFADSKGVAEGYKENLSNLVIDGEKFNDGNARHRAAALLDSVGGDINKAIDSASKKYEQYPGGDTADDLGVLRIWSESPDIPIPRVEKAGNLYRTHIDVDPDTLLDYDRPLSEQGEGVQSALRAVVENAGGDWGKVRATNWTGGDFERQWYGEYGRDEAASKLLDAGIPGLRYRDQMSRNSAPAIPDYDTWRGYNKSGAPDSPELRAEYSAEQQKAADFENNATYNYVMFDDKPISIVERGNANPGLLGTAAAATSGALIAAPIAAAVTKFAESQNSKQAKWDEMKSMALSFANGAVDIMAQGDSIVRPGMPYINAALDAVDMPMQGLYGLTTVVSQLAAGSGFDQALQQGSRVSQQPIDVTADEYAGPLADRGYPGTATALRTLMNITGPI